MKEEKENSKTKMKYELTNDEVIKCFNLALEHTNKMTLLLEINEKKENPKEPEEVLREYHANLHMSDNIKFYIHEFGKTIALCKMTKGNRMVVDLEELIGKISQYENQ